MNACPGVPVFLPAADGGSEYSRAAFGLGFPKAPLWSIFGYFLLTKKVTPPAGAPAGSFPANKVSRTTVRPKVPGCVRPPFLFPVGRATMELQPLVVASLKEKEVVEHDVCLYDIAG